MTKSSDCDLESFIRLLESKVYEEKSGVCNKVKSLDSLSCVLSVPSLSLLHPSYKGTKESCESNEIHRCETDQLTQARRKRCMSPKEIAMQNLSNPTSYDRSIIQKAQQIMSRNLKDSFALLIQANFRNFFKKQLERHVPEDSKNVVINAKKITSSFMSEASSELRTCSRHSPVNLGEVTVSFCAMNKSCAEKSKQALKKDEGVSNSDQTDPAVQPFLFKASVCIDMFDCKKLLTLTSHGNLLGHFSSTSPDIESMHVTIDAKELLTSMRNYARIIVLEAIASKNPITSSRQDKYPVQLAAEKIFGTRKYSEIHLYATLVLASTVTEGLYSVSTSKLACKRPLGNVERGKEKKKMRLTSCLRPIKVPRIRNASPSFVCRDTF